jgi:hypothetical protein
MPIRTVDYSYIGIGPVYMRRHGVDAVPVPVGNVSTLTYSADEESKSNPDNQSPGGGNINTVKRVSAVKGKIRFSSLSPENLARGWRGDVTGVAAGSASGEVVAVHKGGLALLAHAGPTDVVITHGLDAWEAEHDYALGDWVYAGTHVHECTTAGASGASAPTWKTDGTTTTDGTAVWTDHGEFAPVVNVDYEVRPEGLLIPDDSGIQTPTVSVAYSYPGQDVVQILTQSGAQYEIVFGGINEALSGAPHVVRMHKALLGIPSEQSLIGDDYAGLELEFELLSDPTKGVGMSKFLYATLVRPAV